MHNPLEWLYVTDGMFKSLIVYNIKLFAGGCFVLAVLFIPSLFRKLPSKEYTNSIQEAMKKNKEKQKSG